MRASAAATFYYPGAVFSALQAHDTSVLSANAIRSSLNFISDLFGRFLYALAWEENIDMRNGTVCVVSAP
jgi:hypothetical protein